MADNRYFPMFIDLSKKNILVIGGGKIATRRIRTLLKFTDRLTVVAPEKTEVLKDLLLNHPGIYFLDQTFSMDDTSLLEQMDLVLTATDNRELNRMIVAFCKKKHILVNTADDQTLCDFYFPAVIEKDGIVIGLNSGGASPSNVRKMREKIEQMMEGVD